MKNNYYLRVYYEDTDTSGVVYHPIYLNFIERARSEIFFQNDIVPINNQHHFVVKEIDAKFIKPAKLGDELKVVTKMIKMKNASVQLLQQIFFKNNIEIKLFEATVNLVCLDDNKISKIPNIFKEILNSIAIVDKS